MIFINIQFMTVWAVISWELAYFPLSFLLLDFIFPLNDSTFLTFAQPLNKQSEMKPTNKQPELKPEATETAGIVGSETLDVGSNQNHNWYWTVMTWFGLLEKIFRYYATSIEALHCPIIRIKFCVLQIHTCLIVSVWAQQKTWWSISCHQNISVQHLIMQKRELLRWSIRKIYTLADHSCHDFHTD